MPQVVKLPTRKKEEMPDVSVTSTKRHLKPVPKTQDVPKKQKAKTVVKKSPGRPKKVTTAVQTTSTPKVATNGMRWTMRSTEMTTLDGLVQRVEVVDARGRKPKPAVFLTKGELEALTLGMHILQATVKVKQ